MTTANIDIVYTIAVDASWHVDHTQSHIQQTANDNVKPNDSIVKLTTALTDMVSAESLLDTSCHGPRPANLQDTVCEAEVE